jgi:hypothetical protein
MVAGSLARCAHWLALALALASLAGSPCTFELIVLIESRPFLQLILVLPFFSGTSTRTTGSSIMSLALPADVQKVANEGTVKLFGKWDATE